MPVATSAQNSDAGIYLHSSNNNVVRNNASFENARGFIRAAAGIEQLRAAIQLRPDLARAHYNLGQALIAAGQESAGRAALETARALDPELLSTRPSGN